MVNPNVLRLHQLNVVAGRDVVCSCTKQRQVAEDAVLPVLAIEESCKVGIVVVVAVVERRTRQSIDGTVLHLVIAQLLLNLYFSDYITAIKTCKEWKENRNTKNEYTRQRRAAGYVQRRKEE